MPSRLRRERHRAVDTAEIAIAAQQAEAIPIGLSSRRTMFAGVCTRTVRSLSHIPVRPDRIRITESDTVAGVRVAWCDVGIATHTPDKAAGRESMRPLHHRFT